jgi:hypothetical protein
MISKDENGPFTTSERIAILNSLHENQTESLSSDLLHVSDINKKLENEHDSQFKKKFMVFQWFNKLKYTGNKVDLPVFNFDTMVGLGQINNSFPNKLKSTFKI